MQSQFTLRRSIGSLSAGTPVRILAEGKDWADVQTIGAVPQAKGFDMLNDRPLISGLKKDFLVERRPRTIILSAAQTEPPAKNKKKS